MPAAPHTVDLVVKDMGHALSFYRALGIETDDGAEASPQVAGRAANGWTFGFLSEALARDNTPNWVEPVGGRVTVAFRCDDPAEVDAVFARLTAAGHPGVTAPWDSFWGQRYASVTDPDGNRIDLFAPLTSDA